MHALVSKYVKIFQLGLQDTFVYRWNFFIRLFFAAIPLLGLVFYWRAIFDSGQTTTIGGYSYHGMVFYFLLTLFFEAMLSPVEDDWRIAADIREGTLNALLLRPINYRAYRFTLFLSYRVVYAIVALFPILIVAFFFREYIDLSRSWETYALTVLAAIGAGILGFMITYTVALFAFWILEVSTLVFIVFSLEYFFSGHMFPLDIMPEWIYRIVQWTPFPYELFFVIAVYNNKMNGTELLKGFCIQLLWIVFFYLFSKWLWNRGIKKYTAVGG
ncbi:MAG: ABC-2 family transporter protein [Verrucomicrobiota bacterium]|nr:ABC-2 family transporter protein [Verrucomicrobiota bacterium]